jgi:putative NADH-flavin reductase
MKITVLGTRGLAAAVIRQGLALGHSITALSREIGPLPFSGENFSACTGDFASPEDVESASKGADIIVSSLGISLVKNNTTLFSSSASAVISAVKKNNIKLFIMVTGIGAGNSYGHGGILYDRIILPLFMKEIYGDKSRAEAVLFKSDINWIIVRPGFLTDGKLTEKYRVLTGLDGIKCGRISRADAAHFILTQAASRTYVKQTPLITY